MKRHRTIAFLALLTLILKSLIFEPIGFWPAAFVCLVPWLVMIAGAANGRRVYAYSFLTALGFFLFNMHWLDAATRLGYISLSVYQALFFPLMACVLRHAIRTRGWAMGLVFPVVWVGTELVRAVALSGFPWFFLSHSLYRVLPLIQVSDLAGAYGVSFVVAAVNGAIADSVLAVGASNRKQQFARPSVPFALALVVVTLIYGQVQLSRDTMSEGPRIAVFQGDYLCSADPSALDDHERAAETEKMNLYLDMMKAAANRQPDLYVLPESPWGMFLNVEARHLSSISRESFTAIQQHVIQHNAYVVTGSHSFIPTPKDPLAKNRQYNSATFFRPDESEPGRYDKVHLVYFGEIVPFRLGRLRFLYLWLNKLMPFSGSEGNVEYSIFAGEQFRVFKMNAASQDGLAYRFGIPICYEDVMPYVSREFVCGGCAEKRADFLLNISNDGWFGRGTQQPQHLAISVFRAVENRVGIARAVNTGISGFVRPTGQLHDLVTNDPSRSQPSNNGYAVARVTVDSRDTVYCRYGDCFAWMCLLISLGISLDCWIVRTRSGKRKGHSKESP